MVDLPRIPIEKSVTDAPRSQVSGSEITSAYSALAQGLGAIGNRLEQAETADAALEGQNSVYRDADNAVKFKERSNFTAAGREFNRGARMAALTTMASDSRQRLAEMRREAKGDVKTFDAASRAYTNELVGKADGLMKGPVRLQLEGDVAQTRTGMIEEQMRLDTVANETAIKAEITFLDGEMGALAKQGGTATPEYAEKRAAIQTLYDELGGNTLFAMSKREADVRLREMEGRHMGEAIVGKVEQIYEKDGWQAAKDFVEKGLDDPSLPLDPKQRRQYMGIARQYLNGIKAENASALRELRIDARLMNESLKAGQDVDDAEVDEMASELALRGDPAGAMRLLRQRSISKHNKEFAAKPDREQAADLVGTTSGSYVDRVRGNESGNDPNAKNPLSSAMGGGQFIKSTWKQFIRERHPELMTGDIQKWRSNKDLSDEAIAWYAEQNTPILKAAGVPVTDGSLYLAHFAGPEGAVGLHKANPEASAESVLGSAVIAANPFLRGMSAGDVVAWANNKMSGKRTDPKILTTMRTEVASDAKSLWGNMKEGLKKGLPLAPDDVNLLRTQINILGDSDFGNEVAGFLKESRIAEFPAMTPVQQQNDITGMMADGVSADEVDILEGKRAIHKRTLDMLDGPNRDIIGLVSERQIYSEPVTALDLSSPEAAARSLQKRQRVADFGGEFYGREDVPATMPAEVAAMAGTFTSGSVQDQLSLLQTLHANLKPETYMATVKQLADKAGPVFGFAGGLMAKNPEAAMGILRGAAALKANPKLAPSGEKQDDAAAMIEALPMSAISPDMGEAYKAMIESSRARYADLSVEVGDQSGALDEFRWARAVKDVTGGFVEYNGKMVIAPVYGMVQGQFDDTMAGLTDADVDGAVRRGGAQIPVAEIKRGAVLTSVGDGQYTVQLNTGVPGRGTIATTLPYLMSGSGSKFVLDLRPEVRHMKDVNFGGGSQPGPAPPNYSRFRVSPFSESEGAAFDIAGKVADAAYDQGVRLDLSKENPSKNIEDRRGRLDEPKVIDRPLDTLANLENHKFKAVDQKEVDWLLTDEGGDWLKERLVRKYGREDGYAQAKIILDELLFQREAKP